MVSTNEITVYDRVTDPVTMMESLGKSMYEARMFGCSNEAQGRVLALACIAERKNPIELARTYHIIDGKLSMRADAMLAEFRKLGGKVRWIATGDDGKAAKALFSFEGIDTEIGFTIDDAKRANLIKPKGNWEKDPGSMLRARTVSKAIRMLAPEIVAGYYTPEELEHGDGGDGRMAAVVDAEALAKAAASRAKGNGKAKAADEKPADVIEGEFVATTGDGAKPEAKPEATAPADGNLPCLTSDVDEIKDLFAKCGLTPEQQERALAKRQASVVRNLTREQAAELKGVLRTKLAAIESERAAKAADQPPFDAGRTEGSETDPCSPEQVAAIKSLIEQMADKELTKRIAAKLAEAGMSKIAELTWRDAVRLHQALQMKAMEEFFVASLDAKASESPKN